MTKNIIKLKTSDSIEIAGDFYPAEGSQIHNLPSGILLHMMPATKDSWKDFAKKLNNERFQCLAIDLRGHGQSEDGPDGFINFSDQQHRESIKDVEAAAEFLISNGVSPEKIFLVGASIGANLALQYQSMYSEIKASVLLSPGLSYKGIDTEMLIKNLHEKQSVFLTAGGENDEYSTETVQKLYKIAKVDNKELKVFQKSGHGTNIFIEEPSSMDQVINWLKNIYD